MLLSDAAIAELESRANQIRQDIIALLVEARSGHSAGPLGMADVFTALYFHVANVNPARPDDPARDRIFLSNGHICPVLYATLARRGFFPVEELKTVRKINSRLQGHPHRNISLGLENTGGPLAQGISQAVGAALGLRLDNSTARVFCLVSDGEQDEGQTWEAVLCAAKYGLDNLTVIMDRNNIQIDGTTEHVMPLEKIRAKYEAFNWHVIEVDGHNIRGVIDACEEAAAVHERPTMIIAHTIPGKGVTFMENDYLWHGKPPTPDEAKKALHDLRTLGGVITSEHE